MKFSRVYISTAIVLTVGLGACGDDSSSTDDSTVMQIGTAAPEESTVPVETVAPVETAAQTTVAAPAETSPPSTAATVVLPAVQILGVSQGAGGAEAFVTLDEDPEGWAKFDVSMSAAGADETSVKVLDAQQASSGFLLIVDASKFFGSAPLNVSVSWANDAGDKSEVASFVCGAGITAAGC